MSGHHFKQRETFSVKKHSAHAKRCLKYSDKSTKGNNINTYGYSSKQNEIKDFSMYIFTV